VSLFDLESRTRSIILLEVMWLENDTWKQWKYQHQLKVAK